MSGTKLLLNGNRREFKEEKLGLRELSNLCTTLAEVPYVTELNISYQNLHPDCVIALTDLLAVI
jgi:hypothetical protein